jgi:hypothetical protein
MEDVLHKERPDLKEALRFYEMLEAVDVYGVSAACGIHGITEYVYWQRMEPLSDVLMDRFARHNGGKGPKDRPRLICGFKPEDKVIWEIMEEFSAKIGSQLSALATRQDKLTPLCPFVQVSEKLAYQDFRRVLEIDKDDIATGAASMCEKHAIAHGIDVPAALLPSRNGVRVFLQTCNDVDFKRVKTAYADMTRNPRRLTVSSRVPISDALNTMILYRRSS